MKKIIFNLSAFILGLIFITSCTDNDPKYVASTPSEFKANSSLDSIVLHQAGAGAHTAVTFKWDSLIYNVSTPVTFTIQLDTLNGNFSNPIEEEVSTNKYEASYSDSILNLRALKLQLKPGQVNKIKVRLKSNLQYNAMVAYSNVITLNVTPYSGIVLKYPMPLALYLQGGAVESNWGYPIPDAQKMVQVDEQRFALLVSLIGGGSFDFITSSTAWSDPAYKALTSSESSAAGNFIPSGSTTTPQWGGSDITGPTTSGAYKVVADFSTGTYSVTAAPSILTAPSDLYIVGDATPLAWAAPDATQKFTKVDENTFKITIHLTGGKNYAFITAALAWTDPAYVLPIGSAADSYTTSGDIIESGTVNSWGGVNMKSPASSGNYIITVNFKSGTYNIKQK